MEPRARTKKCCSSLSVGAKDAAWRGRLRRAIFAKRAGIGPRRCGAASRRSSASTAAPRVADASARLRAERASAARRAATLACCGGETDSVGGEHGRARWRAHADAFAFDVRAGTWPQAAKAGRPGPTGDGPRRTFWDTARPRRRLVRSPTAPARVGAAVRRARVRGRRAKPAGGDVAPRRAWPSRRRRRRRRWIRLGAAPTSRAVGARRLRCHTVRASAVVLGGLDVSPAAAPRAREPVIQATSDGGVDAHWGAHDVDVIAPLASRRFSARPSRRRGRITPPSSGRLCGLLSRRRRGPRGRSAQRPLAARNLWRFAPLATAVHARDNEAGRTHAVRRRVGGAVDGTGSSSSTRKLSAGRQHDQQRRAPSAESTFGRARRTEWRPRAVRWDWLSWQRSRSLPTAPRLRASAATVAGHGRCSSTAARGLVGGWPADCDAVDTLAIRLGAPATPASEPATPSTTSTTRPQLPRDVALARPPRRCARRRRGEPAATDGGAVTLSSSPRRRSGSRWRAAPRATRWASRRSTFQISFVPSRALIRTHRALDLGRRTAAHGGPPTGWLRLDRRRVPVASDRRRLLALARAHAAVAARRELRRNCAELRRAAHQKTSSASATTPTTAPTAMPAIAPPVSPEGAMSAGPMGGGAVGAGGAWAATGRRAARLAAPRLAAAAAVLERTIDVLVRRNEHREAREREGREAVVGGLHRGGSCACGSASWRRDKR